MRLEKKPLDGLGLEVSGGYRIGIYVIELQDNSVCKAAGLQVGDRLLKVRDENNFGTDNVLLLFSFSLPANILNVHIVVLVYA